MEKVEAYRCEKCEGKGYFIVDTQFEDGVRSPCLNCKGTGIVWLTEKEVNENA